MAYTLVVPKDMVSDIYNLREAKITKSIRAFILVAIQDKIELWGDELKEIKKKSKQNQRSKK